MVSECDLVVTVLRGNGSEKSVSYLPTGLLDGHLVVAAVKAHILLDHVADHTHVPADRGDEIRLRICLLSQSMVQVCNRQFQRKFRSQLFKKV